MVEASGMPMSMCVAWMEPLERLSRMAAQLAPLVTVELMPYFLNRPFSCAMTMGEQSVRAIMPKLRFGVSGASLAPPTVAAQIRVPRAEKKAVAPTPAEARVRNCRRLRAVEGENGAGVMAVAVVVFWLRGEFIQVVVARAARCRSSRKRRAGSAESAAAAGVRRPAAPRACWSAVALSAVGTLASPR